MSKNLTIAEDGTIWLAGRELHPAQEPLAAARREMDNLLEGSGQLTLVLVGSGLGWHARAVLDRGPQVDLVVYEPDPQRLAMLKAMGPSLDGLEIITDLNSLAAELAKRLVYGAPRKVALYAPPAYRHGEPEVYQQVQELVSTSLQRRQTDQQTRLNKQKIWWQHARDNIKLFPRTPELTPLANDFQNVPAFVLGAGPSLGLSLPFMRGLRHKGLVLAAASALGPLAAIAEAPHMVMALEAKDETRQFVQVDPQKTWLAAASSSHPEHFKKWPGQAALYHLEDWIARLADTCVLPTGGNAGSAAFALAVLLGCNPIILIGQDLAYALDREHAPGRPGGEERPRPEALMVPAIGGGEIVSSAVFQSYISWYQESAAYLKERHPQRRVINTTAQGAYIPGFEHLPLSEILNRLPAGRNIFPKFQELLLAAPKPSPALLIKQLKLARREIAAAQEIAATGLANALFRRRIKPGTAARAALDLLPDQAKEPQTTEALQEMDLLLQQMMEDLS